MNNSHHIEAPAGQNQIKVTFGLTRYIFKALLRNKASFFFGLIFPVVIVSVFGALGNSTTKTKIGIDPAIPATNPVLVSLQAIANKSNAPIELDKSSMDDLKTQLDKNKVDGVLEQGDGVGLKLLTSNTNPQGSGTVSAFVNNIISNASLAAAHAPLIVKITPEEVSGKSLRQIDFILPGQIGFSLLSVAIFGVAFSFLTLRKTLVLKRIFATSVKPISFVIAQSLARSVQGVMQAMVLILYGVVAFKFSLANGAVTVAEIAVLSFLGVLTFIGFGIFFANIARDEQTMPILLNLFNLPQLFLSGVFFPTDGLPLWLQRIGNNLPLAYVNTAMRKIATEGASLREIVPYLLGMAAWAIFSYIIAAKTFKSE